MLNVIVGTVLCSKLTTAWTDVPFPSVPLTPTKLVLVEPLVLAGNTAVNVEPDIDTEVKLMLPAPTVACKPVTPLLVIANVAVSAAPSDVYERGVIVIDPLKALWLRVAVSVIVPPKVDVPETVITPLLAV